MPITVVKKNKTKNSLPCWFQACLIKPSIIDEALIQACPLEGSRDTLSFQKTSSKIRHGCLIKELPRLIGESKVKTV